MKRFHNLAVFPGSELELIRQFMAAEHIPETRWLFGTGLELDDLISKPGAISLRQFDVIYRNVFRLIPRRSLGVEFGIALNLSRWGMLSSALLCANTLGHALVIADQFRDILRSRFTMKNYQVGECLKVELHPRPGMAFPVNDVFAYDVFLGTLKAMISQLLSKPFRFHDIELPFAPPINDKHYSLVSEKQVRFGAEIGSVLIPNEVVIKPLPMRNRVTRKIVVTHCEEELERIRNAQSGDIVFTVSSLLAQHHDGLPELDEVAAKLLMSPRTLRRRLQQSGAQYRQLCERHKQQTAIALMAQKELSLAEVGQRCGFKDIASFHKAFKRWTGETPAQYRKQIS